MTHPTFFVAVADVRRGPVQARWTVPRAWLRDALAGTEAKPTADGEFEVELTANGPEVVVRGTASISVQMPCARTLDPVDVSLRPEVFLLLSPASQVGLASRTSRNDSGKKPPRRARSADRTLRHPAGRRRGHSRWETDPLLTDTMAAEDTYDGEQVVLDPFLKEFILLELPMSPQRSDLPSGPEVAIRPPSHDPAVAPGERWVDPRLAPLAAIASRLREDKE